MNHQQTLSTQIAPADSFGPPTLTFKPALENIFAGFVLSVVMVGGGILALGWICYLSSVVHWTMPWVADKGMCWGAFIGFTVMLLGLIVGGVFLARFSRSLLSCRLEICPDGFRNFTRNSMQSVPWSEVTHIRETLLYERPPILKGAAILVLPKMVSVSYSLAATNGREFPFSGNSVKRIKGLGKVFREHADTRGIAWEKVETHQ